MAKILIIEDDPFIRSVYEKILLKDAHEVLTAKDGEEGLEIANAAEPDVIILDMLMPILDGIGFLEKFDVINTHPNTKVIVLSNMMMQDKVDRATQLGAVNYKTKALFSPKEMLELVHETLKT